MMNVEINKLEIIKLLKLYIFLITTQFHSSFIVIGFMSLIFHSRHATSANIKSNYVFHL